MFNNVWFVNVVSSEKIKSYGMSVNSALGLIPSLLQSCADSSIADLKSDLGVAYQGSPLYDLGGEVLDNCNYRSNFDDPDLDWLTFAVLPNGFTVYVYEYAIVACVAPVGHEKHSFVTRLD